MKPTKKQLSNFDLAFLIFMRVLWLTLAIGITYATYIFVMGVFYGTFGLTGNIWVLVSGILSFVAGIVMNDLYDTAFD